MQLDSLSPFLIVLAAVILGLPLIGVAILFAVRRSATLRGLFRVLLLAGLAGAPLTACYGFSLSTVPIAPYEGSGGAWPALLTSLAVFLPIGFGLGILTTAMLAVPIALVAARLRAPERDAHTGGSEHTG